MMKCMWEVLYMLSNPVTVLHASRQRHAREFSADFGNIAREYATKRYRSNLINWGMLPFLYDDDSHSIPFTVGDSLYVPGIRKIVEDGIGSFDGYIIHADGSYKHITLGLAPLTDDEKKIILAGCLINFYRAGL